MINTFSINSRSLIFANDPRGIHTPGFTAAVTGSGAHAGLLAANTLSPIHMVSYLPARHGMYTTPAFSSALAIAIPSEIVVPLPSSKSSWASQPAPPQRTPLRLRLWQAGRRNPALAVRLLLAQLQNRLGQEKTISYSSVSTVQP